MVDSPRTHARETDSSWPSAPTRTKSRSIRFVPKRSAFSKWDASACQVAGSVNGGRERCGEGFFDIRSMPPT